MGTLEQARDRLRTLVSTRELDTTAPVRVRPLSSDAAIGRLADPEFALRRGKEQLIEARYERVRGQAFTEHPSGWQGTLAEALQLDLARPRSRALLVAVINALLRAMGVAAATVHCRDEDPRRCGAVIARELELRFGKARVALVGLQPAILQGLVERFGVEFVDVVDLDPENIGTWRSGVGIRDGTSALPRLVEWCAFGLATGSSLVNGSIDDLRQRFAAAKKPIVFYGNTISGAAALVGLDRICPFGR